MPVELFNNDYFNFGLFIVQKWFLLLLQKNCHMRCFSSACGAYGSDFLEHVSHAVTKFRACDVR
jgi:hypothetical protein